MDNVLERFIAINEAENLLAEEQILRVATDQSKVNPSLRDFTVNARVGGDMNENNKLFKQAQERVERAVIVFTTCAGESREGNASSPRFLLSLYDQALGWGYCANQILTSP